MRVFWSGVAALVLLSAGAASAGLFGSDWNDDAQKTRECLAEVDRAQELQALNSRLVRRDPTLAQLADEGIPTDLDAQAVRLRAEREKPCRALTLEAVRRHRPPLMSAYNIRFFQMDIVYVQLLQRRITFGNANRLMQESHLSFAERESQYLRARSEAERQALAESLDGIAKQMQSSPPPPGAGRLTCRWVGPTLYCDPY